jgi:DNA repair photolyase
MTRRIGRFESKPGVVCPGFWRLPCIAQCPHACAYCYLQGVFWRGCPRDLTEADLPAMQREVERWMERTRCPACAGAGTDGAGIPDFPRDTQLITHAACPECSGFGGVVVNAGELSDSFAPAISAELSLRLVEMFREQGRHTLLLLTKALPPAVLFQTQPTPRVILSFSLGQEVVGSHTLALRTPRAADRMAAAVRLLDAGWRVRFRLDPLVDCTAIGALGMLLDVAARRWERITLGTLRFTDATHRLMSCGSAVQRALARRVARMEPDFGHHPWRLGMHERVHLYRDIRERLAGCTDSWALCKETPEVWRMVFGPDWPGRTPSPVRCNCTA